VSSRKGFPARRFGLDDHDVRWFERARTQKAAEDGFSHPPAAHDDEASLEYEPAVGHGAHSSSAVALALGREQAGVFEATAVLGRYVDVCGGHHEDLLGHLLQPPSSP